VRFGLAQPGAVELSIYDTQGRRVRTLTRGTLPAGTHTARWDGADGSGARVRPGVYYARLSLPGQTLVKRLVALE
jgi:flagellar hook assembly protein FlgD